jgi:hypothetical protein
MALDTRKKFAELVLQSQVFMGGQPSKQLPPNRALSRRGATGAETLVPQLGTQSSGSPLLLTRSRRTQDANCLPQTQHARVSPQSQIKDGATAMA